MIVVDENSASATLVELIRAWYPGRVCSVRDLLPGAVIKDEMIPRLLATQRQPTFVTTNVTDFWQVIQADYRFCVICLAVPTDRPHEISALLRRALRLGQLRAKRSRMGLVVSTGPAGVRLYRTHSEAIEAIAWL